MTTPLHLAIALDGYGWHPQAWRSTVPTETRSVLSGSYWSELAVTAERGLLDFLTIDDTLMPQIGRSSRIPPDRLTGRGDAMTALGAQLYFWARVAYVPLYAAGIAYVRSLVWAASVAGLLLVLGGLF